MATITARMDNSVKDDFLVFCDRVGITASSLFNMFAKACIREQKIPFEVSTLNYEAKRISAVFDKSNEFFSKLKDSAFDSEKDIMKEITNDRRKKFGYGETTNTD